MSYNVNKAIELLKENNVKDALKLLESKDSIFIEWRTEDVLMRAQELKKRISKKTARNILHDIEHYHDAEIGINWDVINSYL